MRAQTKLGLAIIVYGVMLALVRPVAFIFAFPIGWYMADKELWK